MMIQFSYKNTAGITKSELETHQESIHTEIETITQELGNGYDTAYAVLSVPNDAAMRHTVNALVEKIKKNIKPTMIVVAGVGGSSWGILALFQALQITNRLPVVFFDMIDDTLLSIKLSVVERELERGGSPIVCLISKSGTSTETIMCGALLIELLQKYKKKYHEQIVAITDKQSVLWNLAEDEKYALLEIPKQVGGRYSVFTPVGLFPLALAGGDIQEFHQGAHTISRQLLSPQMENNIAALSALITYWHMLQGVSMSNLFVFHPLLSLFGQWYRQLVGESLGKKDDRSGTVVHKGIMPLVSRATHDLHTVIQTYLGGPYDKITTFLSVTHETTRLQIPFNAVSQLIPAVASKSVTAVKHAIRKGVQAAYQETDRPFMSLELPQLSEYYLGQIMMMKIVETIFLAKLMDINPFDQPAVELYKHQTRALLSKKTVPS